MASTTGSAHGSAVPITEMASSRPGTNRSSSTRSSYDSALISAAGMSPGSWATLMPSAEPCFAGFTTSGRPRRSRMSGIASPAPSSRNASWLNAYHGGVSIPAAAKCAFATTLSVARSHASTPGPVYGISRISSSSWTVPSSPPLPCRAMNAASGRSARSVRTMCWSTSSSRTSCPSRRRAASALSPERRETSRSRERPPFRTATLTRRPAPGGARSSPSPPAPGGGRPR